MDRVPYRRVTRRDNTDTGYKPHTEDASDISRIEGLILQCIISGIILVFVLIASTLDIAPTIALRDGLQQLLTGAETLDELVAEARQLGTDWFGWEPVETAEIFTDYFFIDEEPEIYQPPTAEEVSNPTVPEPAVIPGLWD